MKTDSILQQLNLQMMPQTEHTLIFGNDFMLTDNFGLPTDPESLNRFVSACYPFKVMFTLLMFCTEGDMRVRLNLKEYRLTSGCVLVVLPNDIGECLDFDPRCRLAIIAFSSGQYAEGAHSTTAFSFLKYLSKQRMLFLAAADMEETLSIYTWMRRKIGQTDYGFTREILHSYMKVLMSNGFQWLAQYGEEQGVEKSESRSQELFERFLHLVQKHYVQERNIRFYADKLCLTPKYLSSLIHRVSGRFASEWIKDYVLLESKVLLRSRQYTVQQVSEMLHFPNASFFGKYFKERVGCTPREYMLK